jgi:hypothetical protein
LRGAVRGRTLDADAYPGDLARADLPRPRGDRAATDFRRILSPAFDSRLDLRAAQEALGHWPEHPGAPKLIAALDLYEETPVFTRSGLERRFLEVVEAAGLPVPSMNAFVAGHEIDAWWEAERFGVELDVYETHGSRLSFEEDRVRDDELLLAGIETIRVTGPRLDREPDGMVDSVRRHLERRRSAP